MGFNRLQFLRRREIYRPSFTKQSRFAGNIRLFGRNEGPVIPDHQVDVLSVLALALQRRFDLFRQVFAQKISDSFNDHRCSFLRCLYGGFHALRGPAWSPDGCGLYYEKGAARRRRLFHLEKGDFAVIFPGQIHHTQVFDDPENCASMYLLAPPSLAGGFQEILKTKVPVSPLIKASDVHEDIRYTLHALYRDQTASERLAGKASGSAAPKLPAAGENELRSTVHAAFIHLLLCRALPLLTLTDRKESPGMDLAARVSAYLENHFRENITLSSLARALYVSPYSVSRIFASAFRTNFNGYLNDIRVEYVCEMLRRTDKSVTEIYEDAGFESQRTFNRAFRERMRMSPRQFRESGLFSVRPMQDTGR